MRICRMLVPFLFAAPLAAAKVHLAISKGPDDSGANVMLNAETLR